MAEGNSELARINFEIQSEEKKRRPQQQQEQQHVVVVLEVTEADETLGENSNFRDNSNLSIAGAEAFY